jgi:hypothetical protein
LRLARRLGVELEESERVAAYSSILPRAAKAATVRSVHSYLAFTN